MEQAAQALVVELAEMLVDKQVETETVRKALALLCSAFSFDCGLVYEIDQYNHLNLKEQCTGGEIRVQERFDAAELTPECRALLAQEAVCSLSRGAGNTSRDKALLDLFSAGSLVAAAALDENTKVHGMLVFLRAQPAPAGAESPGLQTAVSLLGRYVGIRLYQHKLDFAQTTLESILDNTGIDIYVNDFTNHDILYVNRSMAAPYGGREQFMGRKCWEVLFPGQGGPCEFCPQKNLIDEEGNPTKVYTWDYQRAFDGSWFRVFSAAFRWVDGRLAHVVSSADITDNKRNEALVQYLANYDSLTNLPNRRRLVSECESRINHAKSGGKGYVLFFDIDGFKKINDTLGHEAGDEFLVQLGKFFTGVPMLKDAIYRNGGDEFVAILDGGITKGQIKSLASFIHSRFEKPWELKKGAVRCNTSIGVACYPTDGDTPEELLHKADQAMYKVKKTGGGGICFSGESEDS